MELNDPHQDSRARASRAFHGDCSLELFQGRLGLKAKSSFHSLIIFFVQVPSINSPRPTLARRRALDMRTHSTRLAPRARPMDRTRWPDTATARSRSVEPSQTAGKPGVLNEPPSSAPGTPQPTCTLLTSLLLHRSDTMHHGTHCAHRFTLDSRCTSRVHSSPRRVCPCRSSDAVEAAGIDILERRAALRRRPSCT